MTRLWTYSTPVEPWPVCSCHYQTSAACEIHGKFAQRRSQPSETGMDTHPYTHPSTGDTAAREAEGDQLMANARERWRLIQDLATGDPRDNGGCCCRYCQHTLRAMSGIPKPPGHADDCLWVRANRLIDGTDRP